LDADTLQDPIVAAGRTWKLAPLTFKQSALTNRQGSDTAILGGQLGHFRVELGFLGSRATEGIAALTRLEARIKYALAPFILFHRLRHL
jgi:hypothetical protein